MFNAYYNGKFSSYEDVRIPLSDRSIFFADSVYEVILGGNGKIYQFAEHMDRLKASASFLSFDLSEIDKTVKEISDYLIQETQYEYFYIYVQVSRNVNVRNHTYPSNAKYNLLVFVYPTLFPDISKPISLITKVDVRHRICHVKTTNLLPAVLASKDADLNGADECVFIYDGIVTECSHSNLFLIKNNELYTHPLTEKILPGITRQTLLEIAASKGIKCNEIPFTKDEMLKADEILITSTTKLVRIASKIDGIKVGGRSFDTAFMLSSALKEKFTSSIC